MPPLLDGAAKVEQQLHQLVMAKVHRVRENSAFLEEVAGKRIGTVSQAQIDYRQRTGAHRRVEDGFAVQVVEVDATVAPFQKVLQDFVRSAKEILIKGRCLGSVCFKIFFLFYD